jgi:hypothetical protein
MIFYDLVKKNLEGYTTDDITPYLYLELEKVTIKRVKH